MFFRELLAGLSYSCHAIWIDGLIDLVVVLRDRVFLSIVNDEIGGVYVFVVAGDPFVTDAGAFRHADVLRSLDDRG